MEHVRGAGRGSYIWGRSVHNTWIERLWVDVSNYITQHWNNLFTALELQHSLDINNPNHIWLLHHLFLGTINDAISFWIRSWNQHRIKQRNGPNCSPEDMFGFDMLVRGIRGDSVDQFAMSDEELEVFGIDWEGLQDETLLRALRKNYVHEEGTSTWHGRHGPPPNLNEVQVDPPSSRLTAIQTQSLDGALHHIPRSSEEADVVCLWVTALAHARTLYPHDF
ncbi:hypothetical protein BT96DRAFT_824073 [Gymnopus androsaceus JB14]|uniref:Integrase core domain-containing protein n=1 Tax=Gymnopus androsaceus JB14 TaxID=1447944 RepID=A0A6A4HH97_9AGAR|nr:hypothetical protein BT96DRAFT_824073 [Gymnopus androsaceus JB14]